MAGVAAAPLASPVALGVGANARPVAILIVQVAFVGALVGTGRAVVPILGRREFGIESDVAILSFIAAFGGAKAVANLLAGRLADRLDRRRVLLAGWALALPVPATIALAPSWGWVVAANAVLGVQQGLCWSVSIFMKVDMAGPRQRGLTVGLNELAGYAGTAAATYAAGALAAAHGPRVAPFLLAQLLAVAGLVTAWASVRDTAPYLAHEAADADAEVGRAPRFATLAAAGLVTKLADVAAWGLLPLHLTARGLGLGQVAVIAAAYPAVWSLLQPLSGWVGDRRGKRAPVVVGLLGQAAGLALLGAGDRVAAWTAGVVVLGAGTAAAYPVLLAAAGDTAPTAGRASAIGRYRCWRDAGFVVGGLGAGALADALGIATTLWALALVAASCGVLAAFTWSVHGRDLHAASPVAPPAVSPGQGKPRRRP